MRIKFITSFSSDRETYAATRTYEVADAHAQHLVDRGIAEVDEDAAPKKKKADENK